MTFKLKILLVIAVLVAAYFGRNYWLEKNGYSGRQEVRQDPATPRKIKLTGKVFESPHYTINSTATADQTALVAQAVESFYAAYSTFFEKEIPVGAKASKFKLMLYKNGPEFSANNTSSPWAEAYYRAPVCYAYFSEGSENPYHWMIHEATHQLNNELSQFKIPKWINEGLGTYFGTSKIENGVLHPGKIDGKAYPIWWLEELAPSGNLESDIASGKIIPLRTLITGKGGPDINQYVNLYYIEYWSFTHFLFHYKNGTYAESYRKLIVSGGSLEEFEKTVGPIDRIQAEWYDYLQNMIIEPGDEMEPGMHDAIEVTL